MLAPLARQIVRALPRNSYLRVDTRAKRIVACRARPWRPSVDDVERLSRGDAARVRGTGCHVIPHRLNADERPVFEAAKKKGFLAVKGTGYRRGRKGNPLPNIWRQWCDAKGTACVVVEKSMTSGQEDVVVVDLSTLRGQGVQEVQQVFTQLAAELGMRQLTLQQRPDGAVPFQIIPLPIPGSMDAQQAEAQNIVETLTGEVPLLPRSTGTAGDGDTPGAGSRGEAASPGAGKAAGAAAPGPARGGDPGRSAAAVAVAQGEGVAAIEAAAAARAAVARQGGAVRALKATGLGNSDPQVQAAVTRLKALKADLAALEASAAPPFTPAHDAPTPSASSNSKAQTSSSPSIATSANLLDDVANPWDGDSSVESAGLVAGPRASLGPEAAGPGATAAGPRTSLEPKVAGPGATAAGPRTSLGPEAAGPGAVPASDPEHPYNCAATWQLAALPLFFSGARGPAKDLATRSVAELAQRTAAAPFRA